MCTPTSLSISEATITPKNYHTHFFTLPFVSSQDHIYASVISLTQPSYGILSVCGSPKTARKPLGTSHTPHPHHARRRFDYELQTEILNPLKPTRLYLKLEICYGLSGLEAMKESVERNAFHGLSHSLLKGLERVELDVVLSYVPDYRFDVQLEWVKAMLRKEVRALGEVRLRLVVGSVAELEALALTLEPVLEDWDVVVSVTCVVVLRKGVSTVVGMELACGVGELKKVTFEKDGPEWNVARVFELG